MFDNVGKETLNPCKRSFEIEWKQSLCEERQVISGVVSIDDNIVVLKVRSIKIDTYGLVDP